jgi:CheY-like chemotaxis protein
MARILIIDDQADICEGLSEILKLEGYNVRYALGGTEGVTLARKYQPNLILCDLNMPRCDGFEVLRRLAASIQTAGIPVVMFTAQADEETQKLSRELGAYGFLGKQSPIPDIILTINDVLTRNTVYAGQLQ